VSARRRHQSGSAAIEVLAALPVLAAVAVVAWYLAAGIVAAMDANERLVREALEAPPERGGQVPLAAAGRVPPLLVLPGLEVTARATVRGPVR